MKKKLIIITATLGGTIGCLLIAGGLWVNFQAKGFLEKKISASLNTPVKISRLSTNFFNKLTLHTIKSDDATTLQAEKISLTLTPWNPNSIITSEIHDLGFVFKKQQEKKEVKGEFSPVPITVKIVSGKGTIKHEKENVELTQLTGLIHLKGPHLSGKFEGKEKSFGPFQSSLNVRDKQMMDFSVEAPSINVRKFASYLGEKQFLKETNGTIGVRVSAEGNWPPESLEDLKWFAEATSNNLFYKSIPLVFDCSFNRDLLTINHLKIDKSIHVDGIVEDPLGNTIYDLQITGRNFGIKDFVQRINPSISLPFPKDRSSFRFAVRGSKKLPQIEGDLTIRPGQKFLNFSPLKAEVKVEGRDINVFSSFANGTVDVRGEMSKDLKGPFSINISSVSIGNLAKRNRIRNTKGFLNADITFSNLLGNIVANGTFSIADLQWGRATRSDFTAGSIDLNDNRLKIDTSNQAFMLLASIEDENLTFERILLKLDEQARASAHGFINLKTNDVSLNFQGEKIPPDIYPPLVHLYPDISGSLDFSGTLFGSKSNPNGKISLLFNKLQFASEGGVWNGTTDMLWDENSFSLKKIQIDGGYSGEIIRRKTDDDATWEVNLNLLDSDPTLITEVLKTNFESKGRITGKGAFVFDGKEAVGVTSMTWVNGKAGPVLFDRWRMEADLESDHISLKSFELLHKDKAIRGAAKLEKKNNAWGYQANAQFLRWGNNKLTFDGEVQSTGELSSTFKFKSGQMAAATLWINDYQFNDIKIKGTNTQRKLTLKGDAGPNLNVDLSLLHASKNLRGKLVAQDLQIKEIIENFLPFLGFRETPEGLGDLVLTFRETIDDPKIDVNVSIKGARWHQEGFKTNAFLEISKSTVSLLSCKTTLDKGGYFYTSGYINRDNNYTMHIEGAGTNIQFSSMFNFLYWPIQWDGVTSGSFVIKGEKGKREINIAFDGQHQGLGPFKMGGSLKGKAHYREGEWDLTGIQASSGEGLVKLAKGSRIYVNRDRSGKLRLVADTRNLNAGVLTFFGRVELTGSWKGSQEGSDFVAPPKELDIFARSLWINQYVLDGNITHLTIHKGRLEFSPIVGSGQQLSGEMDYSEYPTIKVTDLRLSEKGQERLYLNGFIGSDKWDFRHRARDVDANIIRQLLDTQIPLSGPANISLTGKGSADDPHLKAKILWRNGRIGTLPLDQATADYELKNGVINLSNIQLQKKNGYNATGNVRLGTSFSEAGEKQKPEISFLVRKGDLNILRDVWPESTKAKGAFRGEFNLSHEGEKRKVSGYFIVNGAKIKSTSYIPNLKRGFLNVAFADNKLLTMKGSGQLGKGRVLLDGKIDFDENGPTRYAVNLLTLSENGISIRVPSLAIPPGPVLGRFSLFKKKLAGISRGEPKFDLTLTGPAQNPSVSGKVELENTVFTYPPQDKEPKRKKDVSVIEAWLQKLKDSINWDVVMTTGKRTLYENELVDARIDGSLHFFGPTKDLSVNGRITTTQGAIVYTGNEFKINDAALEIFTQVPSIDQGGESKVFVYLKADAEKEVFYTDAVGNSNQDTIVMEVDRSLIGEIKPRFRSKNNANLSEERALQLALGIPLSESVETNSLTVGTQANSNEEDFDRFLRTGLVQLLDSSLASPLARALARQTGLVDFIRVTYQEDEDSVSASDLNLADSSSSQGSNITENSLVKYMKGTKVRMGRELSNRLFADYSFRVDEYENDLDLRHEIELAYRVHRNLFLKATSELDSERTLGRPPDRRAVFENQWRFDFKRKKKKKPKETSDSK